MLAAVSNNGLSLRLARSELQRDREIVESAVRCNGQALFYAHGTLQMDKDIVLEAGMCQHLLLQCLNLSLYTGLQCVVMGWHCDLQAVSCKVTGASSPLL